MKGAARLTLDVHPQEAIRRFLVFFGTTLLQIEKGAANLAPLRK
jgi:hypothetical protein